ncbi:MAG: type II secretion system protein [Rhodobiaceae bacterium]|mgnify:CR=1 FL=1|nr:type II secretion system protein [Hyphomonas sp.]MCB9970045.1 type II secretion system protein [Hyphomonas sp.]MCC0050346.1 type II secretion system protein [Rhodobiaceae bacterium]
MKSGKANREAGKDLARARASIRRQSGPGRRDAGYSLIEMVVALGILALAASIAVPNAVSTVLRFEQYATFEQIAAALGDLKRTAFVRDQVVVLDRGDHIGEVESVQIPDGWKVEVPDSIVFSPAAVCKGQGVTIVAPDGTDRYYTLDQNMCRFERRSLS